MEKGTAASLLGRRQSPHMPTSLKQMTTRTASTIMSSTEVQSVLQLPDLRPLVTHNKRRAKNISVTHEGKPGQHSL